MLKGNGIFSKLTASEQQRPASHAAPLKAIPQRPPEPTRLMSGFALGTMGYLTARSSRCPMHASTAGSDAAARRPQASLENILEGAVGLGGSESMEAVR